MIQPSSGPISVAPAFFISTSLRSYNHFHEMWEQAAELDDWQTFSFVQHDRGRQRPPPEEVELARRTLDERILPARSSLASFETFSGRVFPEFDDAERRRR